MFSLPGMDARVRRHWTMERVNLEGTEENDLKGRGHRWGRERGRRWLDRMSGMNGLITIRGIKKIYDSVKTRFNLDTNSGRGGESGSRQIRRGADFCGDLWTRLRDSVDSVFTSGEFPHKWIIVGENGILTHGRGQQRGKDIINLAFDPNRSIMSRELDTKVKGRDTCKSVSIYEEKDGDSEAFGTELHLVWHRRHKRRGNHVYKKRINKGCQKGKSGHG